MPTVQKYGGRRVDLAPLPGARKTAAETPESLGAGVEQARARKYSTLAGVAGQLGAAAGQEAQRLIQDERDRADQVALLEAQNRIATWETQRLYDPDTGALTVKGKAALGLPEQVAADYDKLTGEIERDLHTPRQRDEFLKLKRQRQASLDMTLRRHVFGEMQAYEQGELRDFLANAQSAAVANARDPRRVSDELTRGVEALERHGSRLGLGPEGLQRQVETFRSSVHEGVIDRLLALDQPGPARIYFEETRDQISGASIAKIEKALEEGGLRQSSQQQADEILAAGGTLTEQREQARAIDDPKLRDAVMDRIEHEAAIRDKTARDEAEARLLNAYNIVDRTKDVRQVPPADWAQISGGAREGLRVYADRLAKGVPIETDAQTYYNLLTLAGTQPDAFTATNLLQYRAKLDDGDFKQLASIQLAYRQGDRRKADDELAGFRTHSQIVDDTLTLYGIETTASKQSADEKQAVAQLRRMLDRRVETEQQLTGKKATNDDVQRMLDDLLSQSVTVPGSWWALVSPFRYDLADKTKRLLEFTAGDIPAGERKLIEDALRKAGRPVSDSTVLDLYLETKARLGGGR